MLQKSLEAVENTIILFQTAVALGEQSLSTLELLHKTPPSSAPGEIPGCWHHWSHRAADATPEEPQMCLFSSNKPQLSMADLRKCAADSPLCL